MGPAIAVPGLAALNAGGFAQIGSVSCPSPGNCAAGGQYLGHHLTIHAFVVSEVGGTWGHALQVPGMAAFGDAQVRSVSCPAPGNCAAIGNDPSDNSQPFVVSQTSHQAATTTRPSL